jgi:hypothetical protein
VKTTSRRPVEETPMDIDWHDFVVVEKIELYDDEEMRMINEEE